MCYADTRPPIPGRDTVLSTDLRHDMLTHAPLSGRDTVLSTHQHPQHSHMLTHFPRVQCLALRDAQISVGGGCAAPAMPRGWVRQARVLRGPASWEGAAAFIMRVSRTDVSIIAKIQLLLHFHMVCTVVPAMPGGRVRQTRVLLSPTSREGAPSVLMRVLIHSGLSHTSPSTQRIRRLYSLC